jgi:signal transduction histidine kinase
MTTEFDPSRRATRWNPGPAWLLGSICLNIAFASYIAIQALTLAWQPSPRPTSEEPWSMPDKMIATFAARLPSRDADILWEMYQTKKPQILAAAAAAQSARVKLLSILPERDLDLTALRATFKDALESRARMSELLADTVAEALARISTDGRQQLTRQLQSRFPKER